MIILQIIIISLLVFAIHYTMQDGEIFGFVSKWWQAKENALLERAAVLIKRVQEINEGEPDRYDVALSDQYEKEADYFLKKQETLEKISQPIFACQVCMAPWHGTYLYWLIPWTRIGLPAHDWVSWLVIIIGALGLNSIIVRIFKSDE